MEEAGDRIAFIKKVALATLVVAAVIGLLMLVGFLAEVLLLVFASLLLGIFLRALAEALSRATPLGVGWSLAAIGFVLSAVVVVAVWLYGPLLVDRLYELWRQLPDSLHRLRGSLEAHPWGSGVLDSIERNGRSIASPEQLSQIAGIFSTTLGGLGSAFIVIVLGLYFAAEPELYLEGLLHLVPPAHRKKARQVARKLNHALRWWLAGRFTAMFVIGLLIGFSLFLLGLPNAFILGVLSGFLSFIPNFGPLFAAVPGILVGFSESGLMALYVALTYLAVETLEGYLITPFIERQAVAMPPALLLIAQLAMGLSFGVLGLILASPLTVTTMTLIQMLYLRDVLEEPVKLPGETMTNL
jgi:predicted PurR-regulated permease PerM